IYIYSGMKVSLSLLFIFLLSINLYDQRPPSTNYDESKVPANTLPDVLKTENNKIVGTSKVWAKTRRPEILSLFADNIYGRMPLTYDSIQYSVSNEDPQSMEGKAHLKEVLIEVFRQNKSVKINLVLFIPNNARKPVPA